MSIADKLTQIAENEQRVYDAGFAAGQSAGGDTFYNAFWDVYQNYGYRAAYNNAFSGGSNGAVVQYAGWTKDNFKPKYNMNVGNANSMFYYSGVTDINACLEAAGVAIDFSKCTTFVDMANNCISTTFPPVDISSATKAGLTNIFRFFKTVTKLELSGVKSTHEWGVNAFASCGALRELYISGEIGTTFTVTSALIPASAKSVINALVNYAGTDNEYKYTLTLGNAAWTALEADSTAPTGTTWKEYVGSLGWNV